MDVRSAALDVVNKIVDALKSDPRFDSADFRWNGGQSVEINLYTHEIPNFIFITGVVDCDTLDDSIIQDFVDKWNKDINDQRKINLMKQFIKDITRWGTA